MCLYVGNSWNLTKFIQINHSRSESCTENQQAICKHVAGQVVEFKDCSSVANETSFDCFYRDKYGKKIFGEFCLQ